MIDMGLAPRAWTGLRHDSTRDLAPTNDDFDIALAEVVEGFDHRREGLGRVFDEHASEVGDYVSIVISSQPRRQVRLDERHASSSSVEEL